MSEEKNLTVKAKSETQCACACAENLSEYVLSVDFVNALQNIRNMINNAITNVDLKTILNKLIIEINERLQNVWKHFMDENGGIIEEDNITLAKQKLQTIEKKVGRTIVLSYIKAKTGEDGQPVSKRYNDLYVCLPTIRPANATINEALETNETHPLAWIKIISDDFVSGDDPDDVDLDDILRKLEEFENRLNEIIDIIRSMWAYLCKNWWEFVDVVENQTDENKMRENPNIAQNYYDQRDKNIYVFLKTAKATADIGEPTEAAWIPLLNAENLPNYQNAWRHTSVVSAIPTTAPEGNENFVGNTKYCTLDKNVYVWLPTTVGEGGLKWVSLLNTENLPFYQNAWRHTEVIQNNPTSSVAGQFIGETKYCPTSENIIEKPEGDVYVWLPTTIGVPGAAPYKWFNITRTKEINSISNYSPENLVIIPKASQFSSRFKTSVIDAAWYELSMFRIERYGQMVDISINFHASPANGTNDHRIAYNTKTGGGWTLAWGANSPYPGWSYVVNAAKYHWFPNNQIGRKFTDANAVPPAYRGKYTSGSQAGEYIYLWTYDDQLFIDDFTLCNMTYLFDGYAKNGWDSTSSVNENLIPSTATVDGIGITKSKINELCRKYNINLGSATDPNTEAITKNAYRTLLTRFLTPAAQLDINGYSETIWANNHFDVLSIFKTQKEDKMSRWATLVGENINRNKEGNTTTEKLEYVKDITSNFTLDELKETGGTAAHVFYVNTTTASVRVKPNGWIYSPLLNQSQGHYWTYIAYEYVGHQSYVGRVMNPGS